MRTQKETPFTDEPMSRLKIETFFRQFPWAEEYAYAFGRPVTRVYVQRVEPSLLWYERQKQYHEESRGDECGVSYAVQVESIDSERILLIGGDGKIVNHTEHVSMERRKYFLCGPKISWTEPVVYEVGWIKTTIADALKRLSADEVATIHFVLSYWEESETMIIYKLPNNCSLPEWIEAETKREQKSLQEQCDEIDAEGALTRK
jgi:hypothetical protein